MRSGGNSGGALSDETKKKLSDINKGKRHPHTEETKKIIADAVRLEHKLHPRGGWHQTEEMKKKASRRMNGCTQKKESIEKIIITKTGRTQSVQQKKNTSIAITKWWAERKAHGG